MRLNCKVHTQISYQTSPTLQCIGNDWFGLGPSLIKKKYMYLIISHHSHCYFCYVPCPRSLSLISEAWVIHLGFGELRVTARVALAHNEYIVSLGEPMHKQRAREEIYSCSENLLESWQTENTTKEINSLQLGCRGNSTKLSSWISRGKNVSWKEASERHQQGG